jgi:hypothetical protein
MVSDERTVRCRFSSRARQRESHISDEAAKRFVLNKLVEAQILSEARSESVEDLHQVVGREEQVAEFRCKRAPPFQAENKPK